MTDEIDTHFYFRRMRKQILSAPLLFALAAHAQDTTSAAISAPPASAAPAIAAVPAPADPVKPPVSPWKKDAVANFNVASSYFQDWAAGGEDNLAWTIKLQASAERDGMDWDWASKGSAEFGQIKLGDRGIRKTSDEIKGETVLSRKLSRYLNPFASAAAQTQFARGYKYPSDTLPRVAVSNFLDPLNMTQSVGVGSKPVEWFQTRLGAALREVRTDEFSTYSDDPKTTKIEDWKVEPGLEWVSDYKQTIADQLLLQSTFSAFANFKGWDEIIVVWTSSATYQLSKYINVNASGELHHDIQQTNAWQWKHVLSLGLSYSFL